MSDRTSPPADREPPNPHRSEPASDSAWSELERLFPGIVTRDPGELAAFGLDYTRVYAPNASALALPRTTEDVASILAFCNQRRLPVVPSGGRTGLAGGAVAANGELVLSLTRMRRMDPVDTVGNTVRVQAGAVTAAVHEHCEPHGLTWPVDFSSKGSSQVGGNIATNAGGVKVIRYGLTRQWVLGLQVVLADGRVLELGGALEKNNTGADLRQLFIGSEGTLGVITEATLKLSRRPGKLDVFLFAVNDLADVLRLFREVKQTPYLISAYEFFTLSCLQRLMRHRAVRAPFASPSPFYVLLELEGAPSTEALEPWLTSLFERQLVQDGTLAQHSSDAAALWELREGIGESLSATGLPHKNDIALPIAELESFCAEFEQVFSTRYPGLEICLFGHIGDGNLHINVMKPDAMPKEEFLRQAKDRDLDLFALVRAHRGSISAEHGIGLLKRNYLHFTRSKDEIALLHALKQAFDPHGILNPGKVLL
ncbi:FAD-binding oxidoreductase [Pendulispora albinea]|uniref:FAD-binding oxidoreductase n=1 Tax=Pendulispora albinea TaxID=2741071 RepID=A0ABZ2M5H1_9BACT